MKNKKAFTTLELLAVIIILGILITLAYMGVSQYLTRARNTTYESFEAAITDGVTNYLIDHTGSIPNVGETLKVDVSKLICEGYVDRLEDPRDSSKTCNLESYAIVKRNENTSSNMNIEYEACLKCSNYESEACSTITSFDKTLTKDDSCEVE